MTDRPRELLISQNTCRGDHPTDPDATRYSGVGGRCGWGEYYVDISPYPLGVLAGEELERALDPEGAKKLEGARAELEEARGLRDYARLRRNGARGPVELHMNRVYGRRL